MTFVVKNYDFVHVCNLCYFELNVSLLPPVSGDIQMCKTKQQQKTKGRILHKRGCKILDVSQQFLHLISEVLLKAIIEPCADEVIPPALSSRPRR